VEGIARHETFKLGSVSISPTIKYSDGRGYEYVETSDWLKQVCTLLPCFKALEWPDYSTDVVTDVIDGQDVIIQLWKGWCPKLFDDFPGGFGAEVGVYRTILERAVPKMPPSLPAKARVGLAAIAEVGDELFWWPFPELNATIEFKLINPVTNQTFFSAGPERTYWMNKWMNNGSYASYKRDQGKRWSELPSWWPGNSLTPFLAWDYVLEYKINGKTYPRW
jgi:hypothetical protein